MTAPGLQAPDARATDVRATQSAASRVQRLAAQRARGLAVGRRRRARVMTALTAAAALLVVAPLAAILLFLVARGAAALGPAFGADAATARGTFGGALAGSLVILAIACALGLPVGLGAGLYLAERRGTRRAAALRYLADVLLGVPSIVFGIVAWQLVVRPVGHFSAWAGGVALAAIMIPLVARTTDDVLALVPSSLAQAALALGYPRWRTALGVVLRAALPGVVTGALVAIARVAGEAAPLLFTAFGNQFWNLDPSRPTAALPLRVYAGALGASDAGRREAYAGALVLVALLAAVGALARWVLGRTERRRVARPTTPTGDET